jgi:hypothetical protein
MQSDHYEQRPGDLGEVGKICPGKEGTGTRITALYSLKILRGSIFKGWFLFRGSFWNRECVTIDADAGVAYLKPSFLGSLCRLELDVITCTLY